MGVEDSWQVLFDTLREIAAQGVYRAADDRLAAPVRNLVFYDDPRPTVIGGLAHYTSWESTLKMLDVQKNGPMLRMYNYESANDPQEGSIKPREWARLEKRAKDLLDQYDPEGSEERTRGGTTYGCSFSTDGKDVQDDLMLWRLYGNDGEGCSLKLGSVLDGMYKVRYRDPSGKRSRKEMEEDRSVRDRMDRLLTIGIEIIDGAPASEKGDAGRSIARVVGRVLDGYLHLIKNKAYQHEQEWRMIAVMPDRQEVRYDVGSDRVVRRYIEKGRMKDLFSSASEITIGPRVPNGGAARAYVEMLAREHGMIYTKVRVSSKEYR